MQYPAAYVLTPESKDKNTKHLLRAFFKGEISSLTLNANGIHARKEGATRIVAIKNPSIEILKYAKKEGFRVYPSYRYPGAMEIVSNTI